ncbi:IPT/TIG domain-containing protein [Tieghemostelium lacteum]|uniref:IPT/TIG domain-containing protein n=1 Tax=Tieghemostelium lacteum TaxID=361077 RepID=A0A152AAC6_TIELA|nr:IPT/TIG domain-containing protein [Tieghemostelium lacteum]|eukprot:KYR03154.1 IPT/TIG domain-containing protein [Tieghemostelium lacteum]
MKFLLLYCIITFLSFNQVLGLTYNQGAQLRNIASNLGFTWINRDYLQNPKCGSYTALGSLITCDESGNNAIEVILVAINFGDPTNKFDELKYMKKLTIINAAFDLSTLTTLTGLVSLQELILQSDSDSSSYNFGSTQKNYPMNSLVKVYIENARGVLPTFNSTALLQNVTIIQKPLTTLTIGTSLDYMFTNQLLHFNLRVFNAPTGSLLASPFTNATQLQYFYLDAPAPFSVTFSNFVQAPASLTTLGLSNVAISGSSVFPLYSSATWTNLEYLKLFNLGLTGTMDEQFLIMPSLIYLNVSKTALTFSFSTTFGSNSHLQTLSAENTNLDGQVPSNILDGGLQFFHVRNTSLDGALPSAFMCCSQTALEDTNTLPPSYLFSNNTFTNYFGPNGTRSCSPKINSISPNPIGALSETLTILGKDFGDTFQIILRNSVGDQTSMGCSLTSVVDQIECINPLIQGSGIMTLKLFVPSLPTFQTTFTYKEPIVTHVSSISTLGGRVTITGEELFRTNTAVTGSSVRIYGIPCTNIQVIDPFLKFSCLFVEGITSDTPVVVNVKGLESNSSSSPKFFYKAPLVTGASALTPDTSSDLTIYGMDFWKEVSKVTVQIGASISCPVTFVNHSMIICQFPSTPYSESAMNLKVTVNGRESQDNQLFQFIDTQVCPNACGASSGAGQCDVGIGSCVCSNSFGPSCSEGSTSQISSLATSGLTSPVLQLSSTINTEVSLNAYLYSIIENEAETIISTWSSSVYEPSNNTWIFTWTFSGKTVKAQMRYNPQQGSDNLSGSKVTYPSQSYTYLVSYQTVNPVANLAFKMAFDSPEPCPSDPEYAYPTGTDTSARWMTWTKEQVTYYTRFPSTSLLNNEYILIQSNPIDPDDDPTGSANSSRILVNYPSDYLIYSASFQYDFQVFEASEAQHLTTECIDPPKSSNKGAIIGGVLGGVGGALLVGGAVFLVRQQIKIKKTNSLLNEKLKALRT